MSKVWADAAYVGASRTQLYRVAHPHNLTLAINEGDQIRVAPWSARGNRGEFGGLEHSQGRVQLSESFVEACRLVDDMRQVAFAHHPCRSWSTEPASAAPLLPPVALTKGIGSLEKRLDKEEEWFVEHKDIYGKYRRACSEMDTETLATFATANAVRMQAQIGPTGGHLMERACKYREPSLINMPVWCTALVARLARDTGNKHHKSASKLLFELCCTASLPPDQQAAGLVDRRKPDEAASFDPWIASSGPSPSSTSPSGVSPSSSSTTPLPCSSSSTIPLPSSSSSTVPLPSSSSSTTHAPSLSSSSSSAPKMVRHPPRDATRGLDLEAALAAEERWFVGQTDVWHTYYVACREKDAKTLAAFVTETALDKFKKLKEKKEQILLATDQYRHSSLTRMPIWCTALVARTACDPAAPTSAAAAQLLSDLSRALPAAPDAKERQSPPKLQIKHLEILVSKAKGRTDSKAAECLADAVLTDDWSKIACLETTIATKVLEALGEDQVANFAGAVPTNRMDEWPPWLVAGLVRVSKRAKYVLPRVALTDVLCNYKEWFIQHHYST